MNPSKPSGRSLAEVLATNPGVDRKVVDEFVRIDAALAESKTFEAPAYRLDQPFSVVHLAQPTLKNVVGR